MKTPLPISDRLLLALLKHPELHDEGLRGWELADFARLQDITLAQLNGALRMLMNEELIFPCAMEGDGGSDSRGATYLHIRLTVEGHHEARRLQVAYRPWWRKGMAWGIERALVPVIAAIVSGVVSFVIGYLVGR